MDLILTSNMIGTTMDSDHNSACKNSEGYDFYHESLVVFNIQSNTVKAC